MTASSQSARSQTLDRGVWLLELLAASARPQTIAQLVEATGLHRSIVYRLLRTLEDRRLVSRDLGDTYRLGYGLVALTSGLVHDMSAVATHDLQLLADETDLASFIVVREGDEAMTLLVVEPASPGGMFSLKIGYRHKVNMGAPGMALLAFTPPAPDDPEALRHVREHGWATSTGEVMNGVHSVAAPLRGYRCAAAVAVTYMGERDIEALAPLVITTAERISRRFV
ncbi:MAG TPA: IclR family transcriptional regulator [Dermatophilaceae bacterium]|nr:IclR family transcriptional regulator [Dermatophilaceae bacterium]